MTDIEKDPDIPQGLRRRYSDAAERAGLPSDAYEDAWRVGEVMAGRMAVEEAGEDIFIGDGNKTVGLVVDHDVFENLRTATPKS